MRWMLFLLAIVVGASSGCGSGTDPLEARVTGYFEALNSHDVAATLAFFAEDATYVIAGQEPLVGAREIGAFLEWHAAVAGEMVLGEFELRGETAILRELTASNEIYRRLGIDSVRYEPDTRIVFGEGLIRNIRPSELTAASLEVVRQASDEFWAWVEQNRPERVEQLRPEGRFVFSAEIAGAWLDTLDAWRQDRSPS